MKKRLAVILTLVLAIMLCLPTVIQAEAATKKGLNKTKATIEVGSSVTLKVSGVPGTVKWKSSNPKVAKVSNGKVTGVKQGSSKITATVGKNSYTCKVTVNAKSKKTYVGTWACTDMVIEMYDGNETNTQSINVKELKNAMKEQGQDPATIDTTIVLTKNTITVKTYQYPNGVSSNIEVTSNGFKLKEPGMLSVGTYSSKKDTLTYTLTYDDGSMKIVETYKRVK